MFVLQEKEMEKQKTLYQQARLHDRGAAEMVLQMISASKGKAITLTLLTHNDCIYMHKVLQLVAHMPSKSLK